MKKAKTGSSIKTVNQSLQLFDEQPNMIGYGQVGTHRRKRKCLMFGIVANTGLLRDVVRITTGEPVQCRSIHFFECLIGVMCQRFHSFHQIPFCLTHYIMQARIFNKEKTDNSDTSRIKMIGHI